MGTGNTKYGDQQFLPFKDALMYARSLNLKGKTQWEAWSKSGARPGDIPSSPHRTYDDVGWQGWGHWLGNGTGSGTGNQDERAVTGATPASTALAYVILKL